MRPLALGLASLLLLAPALGAAALPLNTDTLAQLLGALQPAQPVVPCDGPCPDLRVDERYLSGAYLQTVTFAATDCAVVEEMAPAGTQRLVRFTTGLPNAGPGDLVIGAPSQHPDRFVYSTCHGHWHLKAYADYRVWTPENYQRYTQLKQLFPDHSSRQVIDLLPPTMAPAAGNKQGFCVYDLARYAQYGGSDARRFTGCGVMGISRGWGDVYGSGIAGQWVVVTGLPPGTYLLEQEVNAGRFYAEAAHGNNAAVASFTLG